MEIGEIYRVVPSAAIPDNRNYRRPMEGKAVYVHPKGRFAELEFEGVHGTFRESFLPSRLTEKNRVVWKRR